MNYRVISNGVILKDFHYAYQAIDYAKDCLCRNVSAEVWYDSLVDGTPKQLLSHSW